VGILCIYVYILFYRYVGVCVSVYVCVYAYNILGCMSHDIMGRLYTSGLMCIYVYMHGCIWVYGGCVGRGVCVEEGG